MGDPAIEIECRLAVSYDSTNPRPEQLGNPYSFDARRGAGPFEPWPTAELLGEPLTLWPARHRLKSSCTVRFVVMCTGLGSCS